MLKLLLFICLGASCAQLHADYTIPALPPDGADDQAVQALIDMAAKDTYHHRYGRFSFHGVAGRFAFSKQNAMYNPVDVAVEFNGRTFKIPTGFASMDFGRVVQLKPAGIYFLQSGFRWNPQTDMRDRVVTSIRIADASGSVLTNLEYHEDVHQAQQPDLDEAYPQNGNDIGLTGQTVRVAGPPASLSSVQESPPGSYYYWKIMNFLDWASGMPDAFYEKFAFQNLQGRLGVNGEGVIPGGLGMYMDLNGKAFLIPFEFLYEDNWNTFKRDSQGYQFIQGGFRKDAKSGNILRVVATLRVAPYSGAVLPALDYSEVATPAEATDYQYVLDSYWGTIP
jgi:hypothetical protein